MIISDKTLDQWRDFARRDDCLDRMVPSDLRLLVAAIDKYKDDSVKSEKRTTINPDGTLNYSKISEEEAKVVLAIKAREKYNGLIKFKLHLQLQLLDNMNSAETPEMSGRNAVLEELISELQIAIEENKAETI